MSQQPNYPPRPTPAPKRILLATDFSEPADHALSYALSLANAFGAHLDIIHVVPEVAPAPVGPLVAAAPISPPAVSLSERQDLVRPHLESLVERCRAEGLSAGGEVLGHVGGSLYRPIVEAASERSADLIVVGTHGRSGLDRLLLGSVAEGVIRHSSVPVLTVPHKGR